MSGEKSNFFNRIIMVAGVFLLCTSVAMAERINGSPSNAGTTSVVGGGTGGGNDPCSSTVAMSSACATSYPDVTCRQGSVTCYKHESCATCPAGYERKSELDECRNIYYRCVGNETLNPNPNPGLIGGGNQWEDVTTCACNCGAHSWESIGGGKQERITCTCDKSNNCECDCETEYRCAKGYHGDPKSDTDKCDRCPEYGINTGVYGTTSAAGKTKKTDCYIPSSQSLTDTIGTFSFTTQCNAKNAE